MFIPIFISVVSADGLDVAYNKNMPKVIMNISSSSLTCQCSPTNISINATGGLPIWINNSNGQIVINQTYTGDVNISGRNLYLPSGTNTVIRTLGEEGVQGILIDGMVADGMVIGGAFVAQTVPNGFGYDSETIFFPQGIQPNPQWWSYLAVPTVIGSSNFDKFYGFYSAPRSFSSLAPFSGTGNETAGYVSEPTWDGGTSNKLYGYIAKSPIVVSGNLPEAGGILIENQTNYSIYTNKGIARFGDNITAPNICYSNGSNCQASGGNPFNQQLNTSYGVIFRNLTINSSLTDTPLLINIGVNASITGKNIFQFLDNQSLEVASLTSGGKLTVTGVSLARSLVFDPANGALDSVGASLNMNRFTTRNLVIGGTGAGGGTSASLLVGTGSGNTNFGSERAKLSVGTNDNSSIIAAFRGGGGQTKSVLAIVNLTEFQVFNVSTRGEVQASNVTIREILQLYPLTLPTCAGINNGSIARNASDNKPYWCNGTAWGSLL